MQLELSLEKDSDPFRLDQHDSHADHLPSQMNHLEHYLE